MVTGAGHCPECGGALVPVVYGFPLGETIAAIERGEVMVGGCIVEDGQPREGCPTCSARSDIFATSDDEGGPGLGE